MKNIEIIHTKLFINNEFVHAVSRKTFPVLNPSTEDNIAEVAEGDKADIELAVAAAKAAFARNSPWRSLDASARGKLLHKLADLMVRDIEYLASLETLNNGKVLANAKIDIMGSIETLRYFAGYADKIYGHTIPADGPVLAMTRKEPIGVVGQITPWNYPLAILVFKWAAALAAGCTLVLKPAEQTPLTALVMAALAEEAGFPAGVINVVPGYGPTAGTALCLHMDVRKIAFTGSTEIGHKILEYAAASNLKKVSLELGGKSPLVVFDDVDVDEAVAIAHDGVFANHGQNCCAGTRTFVHSKIYDEFVRKSVELTKKKIVVGDPFVEGNTQGPQIDKPSIEKILRYIEFGKKEGAKLETGGRRIGNKGYYVEPTIFSNVTDDMSITKDEIFGPVQSILKFDTIDEVIERANNTTYGLAAGVLTNNLNNALVFSQAVEAGSVWVNCYQHIRPQTPFGGYKKSGFGKDLGMEAVNEYFETKVITIKLPTKN